ncbi:transglutaminase-like domain-containing protein [Akkermansiaceae bacterium]|nr:transglutaminase-like domain-containing protein [Akkermansiaceae bacterium]
MSEKDKLESKLEDSMEWVIIVPRVLIGASLLFWGIMSDKLLLGFGLALLSEGYWLTKLRWNFNYASFAKAWYLCVMIGFFTSFLFWVDGAQREEYRKILEWLPLIFFPIVFAQRYSEADSMPLNTFSMIARKRMNKDIKEGRAVSPWLLNVTMPYLFLILLSAGLTQRSANFYDLFNYDVLLVYCYGIVTIVGSLIFLLGKQYGRGVFSFIIPYALMMMVAVFFMSKMQEVENRVRGTQNTGDYNPELGQSITKIGALEDIKNTKRVQWRMWVPQGAEVPKRVPMTIYNLYRNSIWGIANRSNVNSQEAGASSFESVHGDRQYYSDRTSIANIQNTKDSEAYRFLSSLKENSPQVVIPQLPGYYAFGGLVGELAQVARGTLGTLQIDNPESTVNCLLWRDPSGAIGPISQPLEIADREVTPAEKQAVSSIVDELGLRDLSTEEKIKTLRNYFNSNFTYTRHLKSGDINQSGRSEMSALSHFINISKKGHCEYFATASTLILREAGLKARYVNGFVVKNDEFYSEAYALRGDQVHAWSIVWDKDKWLEVDLTPSVWLEEDSETLSFKDKLAEKWKLMIEDFQVWRTQPENAVIVTRVIVGIVLAVAIWILGRLYFAKNRIRKDTLSRSELPAWKELKKFNKWSQKKLGLRPSGVPYSDWLMGLREHISLEKYSLLKEYSTLYSDMRFGHSEEDDIQKQKLAQLAKQIAEPS